ncbi:MAG: MBOAT family O-acyltransferase [Dysosmobacter sp.]
MALPIGISFYTFQILSYVIDVYRGDVTAQRNLIDLAAYVAMFPQLIAGPIVRYADIAPQLKHRTHTLADAAYGARRFILGLSKKVLLANVLYELISAYKSAANVSVLFVWLYAAAYILHLYFDFSGYSDMAIGLGRIFGFRFIENFNYPYISASVTEFWRRWHMSLGSWFRDYVYIPLGGNRVSKAKWFRNIFIVWLLTGPVARCSMDLHPVGTVLRCVPDGGKALVRSGAGPDTVLKHLYVLLLIAVSFVIFDAASVSGAFRTIASLFGLGGLPRSDALAAIILTATPACSL